jgi:Skp family chaperone for outer membrane proteins
MKLAILAFSAALAFASPALFAQNIQDHKADQQGRIAQGVKSGQLTAGETARLEHQESGINREEHGMRAQDNGHLTAQDRKTLNHQQNQESRRIYRDKHNSRVR